ncbi:MAG: MaoC family dehydratase N-terminal domain-containing protein [Pseudoxanthomonas sp.]
MSEIDIAHLQTWVGRERTVEDPMSPFPARALAAALDYAASPGRGDELPPAWQWLYFHDTPSASETGSDGHPKRGGFLPPVPLPRRMWAAGEFETERPMRLGRSAQRRSRIVAVDLKQGKSGALVFVTLEHEYSQDGSLRLRERQNLVYRDVADGPSPLPAGEPEPEARFRREIQVDPVMLFRYSALTYNGHRIHYDRDYAREEEFYPALVVHGPLLATLLLELVRGISPGSRVRRFGFRAARPSFDTQPIGVGGRLDGGDATLWSAQDGALCMTATATLA